MAVINSLKKTSSHLFNSLYDDYAGAFYGQIKKSFQDACVCDEVLSHSFNEIWQSRDKFESNKERLFTWCYRIVLREISKRKVDNLLLEIFTCQRNPIHKVA